MAVNSKCVSSSLVSVSVKAMLMCWASMYASFVCPVKFQKLIGQRMKRVASISLATLLAQQLASDGLFSGFWAWTTQSRPSWRQSRSEAAVVFAVYGATGSLSAKLARPAFSKLTGIRGSIRHGPWSYRIGSSMFLSPVYYVLLLALGTLSGRHAFFARACRKFARRLSLVEKEDCPEPVVCSEDSRA